jgi:DNA-binding CsgD family transcriptional regulator
MQRLSDKAQVSQEENGPWLEVLEFSLGLYVVVSSNAHILYANRAMRDWLAREASALCERSGHLAATEPDKALEVRRWISAIFSAPDPSARFLTIERGDALPLILRAQVADPAELGDDESCRRLAFISVHDALAFRSLGELSHLFGLTSAERVLAEHILSGDSVCDAQAALGITANTVRTHLKSIYRKTGAHNQADLVRLLKELACIASEADTSSRAPLDRSDPEGPRASPVWNAH